MKKGIIILSALFLPVLVFAKSDNANGADVVNTQNQVQTQTQNEGEDTQLQVQVTTEERIKQSKPQYSPKSETAQLHSSMVSKAVENLVRASERMSDPGIGEEVRAIAQAHSQDEDKANKALDKAEERSSGLKFLVGADWKQLKEVKQVMQQNQVRIRQLQQLMNQVQNESEATELKEQIETLQIQNLELENQYRDNYEGFSLFGWLAKLFA